MDPLDINLVLKDLLIDLGQAILVTLPIQVVAFKKGKLGLALQYTGFAILAGTLLLDIDHFFAARSVSLIKIVNLPARPVSHSLPAMILLSLIFLLCLLTEKIDWKEQVTLFWIVLSATSMHVIHDAASRGITYFLWPLSDIATLPEEIHKVFFVFFYILSYALSWIIDKENKFVFDTYRSR